MLLEKMERRHRHRRPRAEAAPYEASAAPEEASEDAPQKSEEVLRAEQRERRRRSQKSRSSAHAQSQAANISEQSVTLDSGATVGESQVDQGLLETLVGMGMGTLRRNKKSRSSTKNR